MCFAAPQVHAIMLEFGGVAHGAAVLLADPDGRAEQNVATHYGAMMSFSASVAHHPCIAAGRSRK